MVVLDLFSGAGGLSEGFHQEGYKIIAQVEKEKWACETLKTRIFYHFLKENNDLNLYYQYLDSVQSYKNINDAREIVFNKYPHLKEKIQYEVLNKKFGNPQNDNDATSLKDIIKLIDNAISYNNENKVDLMIGGPPCQAYSLVGRGRMKESAEKDSRNFLFYYYLNLVKEYQPKAFIFENVPGILTAKKGEVFKKIKEEFYKIGYNIVSGPSDTDNDNILDFADFGVPQRRKRVILFGYKSNKKFEYPNFRQHSYNWDHDVITKFVIGDLNKLKPGEGNDHKLINYDKEEQGLQSYQKFMRQNSIGVTNHMARKIHPRDKKIYELYIKKAEKGEQLKYSDLPTQLKTHKNQTAFLDRFKVHFWDKLPHTVVAHISKDGHYNIHPDLKQGRSLTVREAARIQSFPDNYYFEGPRTAQYVQVGNAVPPLMSSVIAKTLIDMI